MKKHFIKVAAFAAVAFVAGYGVYTSQQSGKMSELALANVEALAQDESGSSYECCNTCSGAFCGYFLPSGSTKQIKVYYK